MPFFEIVFLNSSETGGYAIALVKVLIREQSEIFCFSNQILELDPISSDYNPEFGFSASYGVRS